LRFAFIVCFLFSSRPAKVHLNKWSSFWGPPHYISGGGALLKAIQHLRNSLPATIDAAVLKKLGLAPKNESYLLNILQFVGVTGEDGTPTAAARKVFTQHDDGAFSAGLSELLKTAYKDLFILHGDKAWTLEQAALVTYFRQTDQTSVLVGTRQATTFQTLASLAGHGDSPTIRATTPRNSKAEARTPRATQTKQPATTIGQTREQPPASKARDFGLTVRIEVNLPASGDKETYDRIFKSIRENLLNG
jgi:hypothetical protein